jgi:hypothetical protein
MMKETMNLKSKLLLLLVAARDQRFERALDHQGELPDVTAEGKSDRR